MECLNSGIAAVNKGSGVNYLKFHYEGVRIDPKTKKIMNKVKVAYQATNLFKGGLTNLGCWDKNKPRV